MRFFRLMFVLLAAVGVLGAEPADDPLPQGAVARLGGLRLRNEFRAAALTFSPDSKLLAAVGDGGCIVLWDTTSGKESRRLPVREPSRFSALRFGVDGKTLVLAGNSSFLRIVDAVTGAEQRRLDTAERGIVVVMAVSRNGKTAAALRMGRDNGIWVWDLASGKLLRAFKGLKKGGYTNAVSIALTPDGKRLAMPHADGSLHLMDVASGKDILTFDTPPAPQNTTQGMHRAVAVSPDGRYLACGSWFQPLILCDLKTGKRVDSALPAFPKAASFAFAPDSRSLAVAINSEIGIFDIASGKEKHKVAVPYATSTHGLTFSPDGRMLASLGSGYVLNLWDVASGRRLYPPSGHDSSARSLAFFADGKRLACAAVTGYNLAVWDIDAGRILSHYRGGSVYRGTLRVVDDGATLQFLASDTTLHRWKPPRGRDERQKIARSPKSIPIAVSSDGREAVLTTHEGGRQIVTIQDAKKSNTARKLELPNRVFVYTPLFSPDGRYVAATCSDRALRLWNRTTGAEVKKVDMGRLTYFDLSAFNIADDGRSLVVGGEAVRIIEVVTGGERLRLWPIAPSSAVVYSPNNRLLACGCRDGRIVVYDAVTGKKVAKWRGRLGAIQSLAFSRDGRLLASGGINGLILVWRLPEIKTTSVALKTEQAAMSWRMLLNADDASAAHRAMSELIAAPAQAVPLIVERFRDSRKHLSTQQVARLVAELDDDAFKVRQRAEHALIAAGADATGLLRKALVNDPSPEMKRRIEKILAHLKKNVDREPLRSLRAIEVLERIGTSQARNALQQLRRKSTSTQLQAEIEASLRRLEER